MSKYYSLSAVFVAAAMASTSLGLGVASADPLVLKIAHAVPQGDPRDLGAQAIKTTLDNDESCDVDVQIFPSGQLGSVEDINEGVQFGAIEMSIMPAAYLTNTEPMFGIFDFPYFWPTDVDKLKAIHDGPAMLSLLDTLEKHNYKALDTWYNGYKYWTANKPLREVADFKGLVARAMPSPVLAQQDIALGMTPTTVPFSEAYTAMQTGAVEAQENPPAISFNMKFHEVQSHTMVSKHGTMDQVILVNLPWWNKLDDGCRGALVKAVAAGSDTILKATQDQDTRALDEIAKAGTEIVELSAEELAAQRDAALPAVREFFIKENGEAAQRIIEALEAELSAN